MSKFSGSAGHNTPYNVGAVGIKAEDPLNFSLWKKVVEGLKNVG